MEKQPTLSRRALMQGAAATTALSALSGAAPQEAAKKPVRHLVVFIHPPVTYSYHRLLEPAPKVSAACTQLAVEKSQDKTTAVCVLQSSKGDKPLVEAMQQAYGERCVVDPNDNSEATRAVLADDASRAFSKRGNHGEWNAYELWTSGNARRWVAGLKRILGERGYALDTEALTMETFGSWSGCHHKYSNFMAAYLGLKAPALLHAAPEYCTHKGWPMVVTAFDECIELDRHVLLFLMRRADGCPMAQYWDGLRPFYERAHTATVTFPQDAVDLFSFTPNSLIQYEGDSRKTGNGFIADVGDGCRPAFTTIVGKSPQAEDIAAFREALANAVIAPRPGPAQVMYAVEV